MFNLINLYAFLFILFIILITYLIITTVFIVGNNFEYVIQYNQRRQYQELD